MAKRKLSDAEQLSIKQLQFFFSNFATPVQIPPDPEKPNQV
jgi:hypothetical protein